MGDPDLSHLLEHEAAPEPSPDALAGVLRRHRRRLLGSGLAAAVVVAAFGATAGWALHGGGTRPLYAAAPASTSGGQNAERGGVASSTTPTTATGLHPTASGSVSTPGTTSTTGSRGTTGTGSGSTGGAPGTAIPSGAVPAIGDELHPIFRRTTDTGVAIRAYTIDEPAGIEVGGSCGSTTGTARPQASSGPAGISDLPCMAVAPSCPSTASTTGLTVELSDPAAVATMSAAGEAALGVRSGRVALAEWFGLEEGSAAAVLVVQAGSGVADVQATLEGRADRSPVVGGWAVLAFLLPGSTSQLPNLSTVNVAELGPDGSALGTATGGASGLGTAC